MQYDEYCNIIDTVLQPPAPARNGKTCAQCRGQSVTEKKKKEKNTSSGTEKTRYTVNLKFKLRYKLGVQSPAPREGKFMALEFSKACRWAPGAQDHQQSGEGPRGH